jgi:light-regulated signal transduction histidine kinase (bacteriophytochrome)
MDRAGIATAPTLNSCEGEPIHRLGLIQPHGYLVGTKLNGAIGDREATHILSSALDKKDIVRYASANAENLFDVMFQSYILSFVYLLVCEAYCSWRFCERPFR